MINIFEKINYKKNNHQSTLLHNWSLNGYESFTPPVSCVIDDNNVTTQSFTAIVI
jgi:hypothetical protein